MVRFLYTVDVKQQLGTWSTAAFRRLLNHREEIVTVVLMIWQISGNDLVQLFS